MHNRIKREKRIIELMISVYCQDHHQGSELCENCTELKSYAFKRLLSCPFEKDKPVCSNCKIHCYNKDQQGRIKEVMRYSGRKMLSKYPKDTILYYYDKLKYKNHKVEIIR